MRKVSKRRIALLFLACTLPCLSIGNSVMASNRALGLRLIEDEGQMKIAILLETRPRFRMNPIQENRVRLTLYDTLETPRLERSISADNVIIMEKEESSSDLVFEIDAGRPVYETDSSWIEDKRILYIHISPADEINKTQTAEKNVPYLKGIRFGFKEKAARMVMKLDHKPLWGVNYVDPTHLAVQLGAVTEDLEEKQYGPIKWLKQVTIIRQKDEKLDISLRLDSSLNRIRTFNP